MSNSMIGYMTSEDNPTKTGKKRDRAPVNLFMITTPTLFVKELFLRLQTSGETITTSPRCLKQRASDLSSMTVVKLFTTLFFLFTSPSKTEAVVKIPSFQGVEAALESTICAVREEIVNIRDIYPSLPPDALFTPNCIKMMKCSGCCQSDIHMCKPTSVYTTQVQFLRQFESRKTFEYVTLNFTHHEECACQNAYEPECIQHECSENEVWNQEKCKCEDACMPRDCGPRKKWNPGRCRCECSPCHPSILFHLRFNQDQESCSCECRRQSQNMRLCARKRARYSRDHCRCVSKSRNRHGY